MGQENVCLLCNTENAKYDKEFLSQRAYFSAPKLHELRVKWNEAIIKIHPILEQLVNNVNTYKICDLHFKESDIKKSISDKSSHQSTCALPLWKWVLKIKALPLSTKELENDKYQIFKEKEKSKENLNFVKNVVNQDHAYMNNKTALQSENNKKTKINSPLKENEKGKQTQNANNQPIKHERKNVKFTPYSVKNSAKTGSNEKSQILQLQTGKNQVLVATSTQEASVSSPIPVALQNSVPSPIKYPVISNVTSLASNTPKFISIRKIASLPPNCPSKVIPLKKIASVPKIQIPPSINSNSSPVNSKSLPVNSKSLPVNSKSLPVNSKSSPVNSKSSPVSAPTIAKSSSEIPANARKSVPITFENSISEVLREKSSTNKVMQVSQKNVEQSQKVTSPFTTAATTSNIDVYKYLKLIEDLRQNSLPSGWAYEIRDDKILFTQYSIARKFPIFLSVDTDLRTTISVGYEAAKFIPLEIRLKSFADIRNCLRKMENLKWCLGIGFDQNNFRKFHHNFCLAICSHSDMCLILTRNANSRCKICSKIRHNAQKRENNEITKQRKISKDLRPLMNKLKRLNKNLEAKVCKLKLMVNHLKKKQCTECLHNKFLEKNSIQMETEIS